MDLERDDDRSLLEMAEREERRLAQELHDTLCQSLAGLSLLAESALRRGRDGKEIGLPEIQRISEQLNSTIGQSRTFLASQILTTHPERLPDALGELMDRHAAYASWDGASAAGICVPDPAVTRLLYRIVRETVPALHQRVPSWRTAVRLGREGVGIFLEIRAEGSEAGISGPVVFDPDKMLRRFARALGVTWQESAPGPRAVFLRCVWAAAG